MEVWYHQSFSHLIKHSHDLNSSNAQLVMLGCPFTRGKQDSTSKYVGMAANMTLMVGCMCSKYEALPRDAMNTLQWAVMG
jgi:hypothetical protein